MSGAEDVSREDLLALIVELCSVNAVLQARVVEQDERIALQDKWIAEQDKRIQQLERALSRNSGNSSGLHTGEGPAPQMLEAQTRIELASPALQAVG